MPHCIQCEDLVMHRGVKKRMSHTMLSGKRKRSGPRRKHMEFRKKQRPMDIAAIEMDTLKLKGTSWVLKIYWSKYPQKGAGKWRIRSKKEEERLESSSTESHKKCSHHNIQQKRCTFNVFDILIQDKHWEITRNKTQV